jgi:hypothetical protein
MDNQEEVKVKEEVKEEDKNNDIDPDTEIVSSNNSSSLNDTEIVEKEKSSDIDSDTEIVEKNSSNDNTEEIQDKIDNDMDNKIDNLKRRLSNLEIPDITSSEDRTPLENVVIEKDVDLTTEKGNEQKIQNNIKKPHKYKSIDEIDKCNEKEKLAAKCVLCPCLCIGTLMCYFGYCLGWVKKCCCCNKKNNSTENI